MLVTHSQESCTRKLQNKMADNNADTDDVKQKRSILEVDDYFF